MILRPVNPFALRDLVFSHGWIALPPWSWRAKPGALLRIERLPSGQVVPVEITTADPSDPTDRFRITLPGQLSAADTALLERRLRWILRADEDMEPFHTLLRGLPGCEAPAARGEGRL